MLPTKDQPAQPWTSIPPNGPLLRPSDAADYLGISLSAFYMASRQGELPAPVKIVSGKRASGVPRPWLDAVIAARIAKGAAR